MINVQIYLQCQFINDESPPIVSDLRQVDGFLWILRFPPPLKTDRYDITEILLKVVLNTITLILACMQICILMNYSS
jgi:hypothetical protein